MQEIEEIIKSMKKTREEYKISHSRESWWEYYELRRTLQKLDPNNEELNIAVSGFSFGAGLKD